jgi:hypothetical protein
MILVPYFIKRTDDWIMLSIFLSLGGRQGWHIEPGTDKVILNMLKENGFPVKTLEKTSNLILAHVDSSKINLSSFYTWEEINPQTSEEDIWRTLKIPVSLWSCDVFRENFIKLANLPEYIDLLFTKV